jgi:hypothetical protein
MASVEQAVTETIAGQDTWLTRSALTLARQIDEGESVPSATRELRAVMAQIVDAAPSAAEDPADDIAARRAKRLAAG